MRRAVVEFGPAELPGTPQHHARLDRQLGCGPRSSTCRATPRPGLFDDLDPIASRPVEPYDELAHYVPKVISGVVNWTIAASPTPAWAERVLGEPDVDGAVGS